MPLTLLMPMAKVVWSGEGAESERAPGGGKPWKVYTEWPFGAGEARRRQAETAKGLGIPVEKTLDLGNGVTLELELIPAGRFMMGTPEPVEPDWVSLMDDIVKGQILLVVASSTVLVFVFLVFFRAWRLKRRPQMSLRFFMVLILALSLCSWGGVNWHQGLEAKRAARSEYDAGVTRFKQALNAEKPAHAVTLSNPFYMGKFEVTQEQYEQVIGTNPSDFKGGTLPVERVSWDDAQRFCQKLSTSSGCRLRLPTEAEWEYACRAGTTTVFCSGDAERTLDGVGLYDGNAGGRTHPVGQKKANAWGLYDMHGNVWEWCQDWGSSYTANALTNPQGAGSGTLRVLRGGSWDYVAQLCRSAIRSYNGPDDRHYRYGFRVVVPRTP